MSSLSWAATCPVKNWKIKHHARSLCCTVSVVSSHTYYSTLTRHAPATQTSFVLFKEARLSPFSRPGSCSSTCLAHASSDLPSAGSPSLFRTQSNVTSSEGTGYWEGLYSSVRNMGKSVALHTEQLSRQKRKLTPRKTIKGKRNILQLAQQHLHKHKINIV